MHVCNKLGEIVIELGDLLGTTMQNGLAVDDDGMNSHEDNRIGLWRPSQTPPDASSPSVQGRTHRGGHFGDLVHRLLSGWPDPALMQVDRYAIISGLCYTAS